MIYIKSEREIQAMRQTCNLAAETLSYLGSKIEIGMSTDDINTLCHKYITERGAYPAPLNYHGFPKSVCTSKNEVICHGIPSPTCILNDGDIINIDVTTVLNNFYGDTNRTFYVGNVDPQTKTFVNNVYDCMMAGIKQVVPGNRIGNIGAAIEEMAHKMGYSVVEEYCGHGIGRKFHEDPQILHYGERNTGEIMRPGMTFTIEPMINIGKRHCKVLKDGWTVVTSDGSLSAQFEHTVLVTETGYEILTLWPN